MAFALVQSKLQQAAFAATKTITYTSTTGSGRLLVLFVAPWGGSANAFATGVSDPVNGAWTQGGTKFGLGNTDLQIYYKLNAASVTNAQNVSVSLSGTSGTNGDQAIVVAEFSCGTPANLALDPSAYTGTDGTGTAAAATTVTTAGITTANASDLYLFGGTNDAASNVTWTAPTSPWQTLQDNGSITSMAIATRYRINSDPAGAYTGTATQNLSSNMIGRVIAFTETTASAETFPAGHSRQWQNPLIRMKQMERLGRRWDVPGAFGSAAGPMSRRARVARLKLATAN
jgi:hypothetical protein